MPKESLTIKGLQGGINTSHSPSDIKDNEFVDLVNFAPGLDSNLKIANQYRFLSFPFEFYFLEDQFNEGYLNPNNIHLVPGWGSYSFRSDYSIAVLAKSPSDAKREYNLANYSEEDLFWNQYTFEDSLFLQAGKEYKGEGYHHTVVPFVIWSDAIDDGPFEMKVGLMLYQSNFNMDSFLADYSYKEFHKIFGQSNDPTEANQYWYQNCHLFSNFFRHRMLTMFGTLVIPDDWFSMEDVSSGEYSLDRILFEMPERLPKAIPSFKYMYTDNTLKIYDSHMAWQPRIVNFGKKVAKFWWPASEHLAGHDFYPDGAVAGLENPFKVSSYSYLNTYNSSATVPDSANLTTTPPDNDNEYGTRSWAFGYDYYNNLYTPTGITSPHHVDVVFADATHGEDYLDDDGIERTGRIWGLNTLTYDFTLGIAYFRDDLSESEILPSLQPATAPKNFEHAIEMRVRFKYSAPGAFQSEAWDPSIRGFKIYMQINGYHSWYEMFKVDFKNSSWTSYSGEEGGFTLGTGVINNDVDSSTDPTGLFPLGMECKTVSTSTGSVITQWPLIFHNPIVTYDMNNDKKSGEVYFPKYGTACIASGRLYAGDLSIKGVRYPDRLIRSAIHKFDSFSLTDFINVEVSDGDAIVRLESFGSKVFQFKTNILYIIETAGGVERLVDKRKGLGVQHYHSVLKEDSSLIWVNENGCFIFDGKKITNLIDKKIDLEVWRNHFGFSVNEEGDVTNSGFPELAYEPNERIIIVEYNPFDTKELVQNQGYDNVVAKGNCDLGYHYSIPHKAWYKANQSKPFQNIITNEDGSIDFETMSSYGFHHFMVSNFIAQDENKVFGKKDLELMTGNSEVFSDDRITIEAENVDFDDYPNRISSEVYAQKSSLFRIYANRQEYSIFADDLSLNIDEFPLINFFNIYKHTKPYYHPKLAEGASQDIDITNTFYSLGDNPYLITKDFNFKQPSVKTVLKSLYITYRIEDLHEYSGTNAPRWGLSYALNGSGSFEYLTTLSTTNGQTWSTEKIDLKSLNALSSAVSHETVRELYSVQFKLYGISGFELKYFNIDIKDISITFRRKAVR